MILVNGLPVETVDVRDRGLAYGDGVFRTLRVTAGRPVWWGDHYAKLEADCAALGLACPDAAVLHDEVCRAAGADDSVVKILVTRGSGARGYACPPAPASTRVVLSAPLPAHARQDAPDAVVARWCALRLARQPRLAGVKHLNRLENVLARAEWDDPEIFEGLLCDDRNLVVGGVMSNLFWASAGTLHTPDLSQCGVTGVARTRLLRALERRGMAVHIEQAAPAAILAAEEVMICNSVIGVRRIARLDDVTWSPAGWTEILKTALYDEID